MKINKEEYNDFSDIIGDSKKDLLAYIEKRVMLLKLKAYEKAVNFASRLLLGAILAIFVLVLSIISVITLGLYLGSLLHNYPAGFGILVLLLLLIMILVVLNQRRVRRFLANLTLRIIKKIETDED